jgi:ribonucleoside-triphosphate reductase
LLLLSIAVDEENMSQSDNSNFQTHPAFIENTSTPLYSQFIHLSRYSRWLDEENRRETWEETVSRYIEFFRTHTSVEVSDAEWDFIKSSIIRLRAMPSMRALMTAGKALERDHVAGYNCSYLPIDHMRAFDELMYILMCGTGVGFSVERQYVSKLPDVADQFYEVDTVIDVRDSKIGWASSLRQLISLLYNGTIPKWDLSKIRPAGARLKTFGGRASGPEPLDSLFKFTVNLFKRAAGRKLSSLECHDLVCKIADIVVVGGVRRSALISLSNVSDDRMRLAKSGQWWVEHPHRQLANNSAAYTERPEFEIFLKEWNSLYESKSGERGVFSRAASKKHAQRNGRRDLNHDFGTNPCSEIILRPYQFCNLSEVVVRADDSLDDVLSKIEAATIMGTLQSTLTDFRYLRPIWKRNTEEERLLGVSLTGIMDHPILGNPDSPEIVEWLTQMRDKAIEVNKEWASRLGIPQSSAITCVKPSGTVSQLVDSASGIHPRFSKYYIRRVRCDKKDPLAEMMRMWGFPCEDDVMNPKVLVFSFPIKAPSTAKTTNEIGAMAQLKLWKIYQTSWCEHKPSITVYYRDSEFLEVGAWIWNNFDVVSGISFLPHSDHVYQQAPYEEISEETYVKLVSEMPKGVDWAALQNYEVVDTTSGSQTLACAGGVCEVVDLVSTNSARLAS